MLPRRFRLVAPGLVLALLALPACALHFGGDAAFRDTRIVTEPHVAGSAVEVRTSNGSIEASRGDVPEVRVTAKLRARTEERLRDTRIVTGRRDDGALLVEVRWPGDVRYGNEGCGFEIVLPDARGILARSANGRIVASGLGGLADLETSNGEVVVEDHDGDVRAASSNGAIRLERITGQVVARTSNGAIRASDTAESVQADTSNGPISIRLAEASPGPVRAETSNGSIELELGSGFRGELSAKTTQGTVRVDASEGVQVLERSRKAARLSVGGTSPLSVAKTSNGSISIRVR